MKSWILVILLSISSLSFSQNRFGQFTISAAPTYSVWRGLHRLHFQNYQKHFKFTVGAQLHVDWALIRRLSIGIGSTFHRHHLVIDNYEYVAGNTAIKEVPTQSIDVWGVYFRGLWHFYNLYEDSAEEIDLYFGGQYTALNYRTFNNSGDPDFPTYNGWIDKLPVAVVGIRYYPTEWFGIGAEIAAPGPYFISMGANFRFGGRDKFIEWNPIWR